uniref:Uncharacterized protein n=3 Tax=Aegilops tauschii subsp. strangulata TaxID=200361 RepID=A0A453LML8_AEGTS
MAALGASESCEDAWKGAEEGSVPVAAQDREYGRPCSSVCSAMTPSATR